MNNIQRVIDSDYGTLSLGPELLRAEGEKPKKPKKKRNPKGQGGYCLHTVKGCTYYRASINIDKRRFTHDCRTREQAEAFLADIKAKYQKKNNITKKQ